jgi:hypothetical protein
MTALPIVVVAGNAQAQAVAAILRSVPDVARAFDVRYAKDAAAEPSAIVRAVQCWGSAPPPQSKKSKARTITFSALRFPLLWPLSIPNPHNRPELPDHPFGRFPYTDTFVSACLGRNVPPDEILAHCSASTWPAAWPDLDKLFRAESRRLTMNDLTTGVKIGSYVLKHFRRQRLFWTVDHPTDRLLAELAKRIATEAKLVPNASDAINAAFQPSEEFGLLSAYAVPVHRYVARHFDLEWCRGDVTYPAFDKRVTLDEYFRALIRSSELVSV